VLGAAAQPLDRARRRAALVDELGEARPADRDDRDLRAGEDAVREDEREDDDELDEDVAQGVNLPVVPTTAAARCAVNVGLGAARLRRARVGSSPTGA
jgi:hypothetical protein